MKTALNLAHRLPRLSLTFGVLSRPNTNPKHRLYTLSRRKTYERYTKSQQQQSIWQAHARLTGKLDEEQRDALPEAPDLPDLDDEAEEQTEEEMVPPLQTEDEMNQVKTQEHLLDAKQDTAEDEEVSEGPIDEITESEGEDHDTDTTTEGLWPQQLEEEKNPQEQLLLDEDDEWSAVNW